MTRAQVCGAIQVVAGGLTTGRGGHEVSRGVGRSPIGCNDGAWLSSTGVSRVAMSGPVAFERRDHRKRPQQLAPRASAPGSPSSAGTAEPQQGSAFVPCALTWIMPEANRLVG